MSSWGVGTFDDDIACDWLEDLFESDPVAFLRHCLDLSGHEYLEHLACVGVVCSAEVVLGLCASPRPDLPEAVYVWLNRHGSINGDDFLAAALTGLRRVTGPKSEMRERWEDHVEWRDQWKSSMADLDSRLAECWKQSQSGGALKGQTGDGPSHPEHDA